MEGFVLLFVKLLVYIGVLLVSALVLMWIGNGILNFDLSFSQSVALLVCADIIFNRPTITVHENNSD